jgi:hypothetical protein
MFLSRRRWAPPCLRFYARLPVDCPEFLKLRSTAAFKTNPFLSRSDLSKKLQLATGPYADLTIILICIFCPIREQNADFVTWVAASKIFQKVVTLVVRSVGRRAHVDHDPQWRVRLYRPWRSALVSIGGPPSQNALGPAKSRG